MSEERFTDQKCVLCYTNYLDCGEHSRPQQLTQLQSIVQTCVKYIPNDISSTVSWNQFDESNVASLFCDKCYEKVSKLSKLNKDLEEIQTKINELVNLLVSYVKEQRKQHCGYSAHISSSLDSTVRLYSNDSQIMSVTETEVNNQIISLNNYDEAESDNECAVSLDSGNAECDNLNEEVAQQANVNTKCVSQSDECSLKSFIIPPGQIKPKSGLQKMLEGSSGYECPTCHKRFSRYTIMKTHDCSKPTVECEICGMSFSGVGVLKIHTRSHTGEKPYKCETCGKAFSIKANLKDHMGIHTGKKTFECEICKKTFKQESGLVKHKLALHRRVEDKIFKCDVCSKNFKRFALLKNHMVKHSSGTSTPFKCDICEKGFDTAKYVMRHIQGVHSQKEKPWKCDICGKRFVTNFKLKRHALTHNEDKPFQCSFCEKSFKREDYLKMHESTHSGIATFDCSTCGKSFTSARHLQLHQRYHKESEICELCGKSVSTYGIKKYLQLVHGSEIERRPYVCELCGTGFMKKYRLVHHYKNYCHICSKSTRRMLTKTLLAHQILMHTVNTVLYPDIEEKVVTNKTENIRNSSKRKISSSNLKERRSNRGKYKRKVNYNDSSSEDITESVDSDGSADCY